MRQYAAFLRGINISGKNKINMAELKAEFELSGFRDIKTCLNSGNIVFSSGESALKSTIEKMIADKFGLNIPAYVIPMGMPGVGDAVNRDHGIFPVKIEIGIQPFFVRKCSLETLKKRQSQGKSIVKIRMVLSEIILDLSLFFC